MDRLKSEIVGPPRDAPSTFTEADDRMCRDIRRRIHGGITTLIPIVMPPEGVESAIIFDDDAPQEVDAPLIDFLVELAEDPSKVDGLNNGDWFTPDEARVIVPSFDTERWSQDKALLELSRNEQMAQGLDTAEIASYYRHFSRPVGCLALSRIASRLESQSQSN